MNLQNFTPNKLINKIPTDKLLYLVILGFLTTGYISFQLVSTLCDTWIEYIVAFNMTFVMQYGSFFFYTKAVKERKSKFRNWTIAIALFTVSIVATASLSINQVNESRNELILSSKGYEQQQKAQQRKEELIDLKKAEITALQNESEFAIASVDADIALKNDEIEMWKERERKENNLYYGQINRVKNEIGALESEKRKLRIEFADRIQLANENLTSAYNNANDTNNNKNIDIQIEATKGYLGFLVSFTNWFNINFDKAMILTQLALAVIFELTIVYFHVEYASRKPVHITEAIDPRIHKIRKKYNIKDIKPKFQETVRATEPATISKKIGFTMDNDNITQAEIQEYKNIMYATAKGNVSAGYKQIARKSNKLSQNKCQIIKKQLVNEGLIRTEGTRTYILG